MNQVLIVSGLPDLSESSSHDELRDYAKQTFIDEAWLERTKCSKHLARSFCGIPVEVKGRLWGVLVFDSRNEKRIQGFELYKEVGRLLGALLER